MKNLGQLAASIAVRVTRTERLRWYRRYAAELGLEHDERRTADLVAAVLARKVLVIDEPID